MKKWILIIGSMILLGVLTFSITRIFDIGFHKTYDACYFQYDSLADIVKRSNIIVTGEIIDVEKNKPITVGSDQTFQYTVSSFKIDTVLKGNVSAGQIIKVKQWEDEETNRKVGFFTKKEKLLLYLIDFNIKDMPYSLINPHQGQLILSDNNSFTTKKLQNVTIDIAEYKDITSITELEDKILAVVAEKNN